MPGSDELVIRRPGYVWIPQYNPEGGTPFDIATVRINECPRSAITPEAQQLVEMEALNRHTRESTGACLFGSNSADWPAVWHDVVTTLQMERVHEEDLRMKVRKQK